MMQPVAQADQEEEEYYEGPTSSTDCKSTPYAPSTGPTRLFKIKKLFTLREQVLTAMVNKGISPGLMVLPLYPSHFGFDDTPFMFRELNEMAFCAQLDGDLKKFLNSLKCNCTKATGCVFRCSRVRVEKVVRSFMRRASGRTMLHDLQHQRDAMRQFYRYIDLRRPEVAACYWLHAMRRGEQAFKRLAAVEEAVADPFAALGRFAALNNVKTGPDDEDTVSSTVAGGGYDSDTTVDDCDLMDSEALPPDLEEIKSSPCEDI